MLASPINLAIVDDHTLFRTTLKNFLSEQKNLRVTVQAAEMFELIHKLKHSPVDVLLMDIFLPEMNGEDAIKAIRNEHPGIRILILSMSNDLDLISDLLNTGIHGYVSKSEEPEELLQAIEEAADNRIYRNRIFTEALYLNKQNTINPLTDSLAVSLNEREKKVLQLLWEEKSNKEIADELFLGIRSVEKIRQDMKEKLNVRSTVGLLKYAIERRIIKVDIQKQTLPGFISSKTKTKL